ncbi:hypothetical protein V8J36_05020 [Frigidibacter sp. MR17.14]|uniref:hypothetical protein n=1 Tax=Frigidibacter sp. MR17.14 TaxID=3126509 RepID=UPI00301302E7
MQRTIGSDLGGFVTMRMQMRLAALVFTLGWSSLLAFGWLALSAPASDPPTLTMTNALLAALGGFAGLWSWLALRRAMP